MRSKFEQTAKGFLQRLLVCMVVLNALCLIYLHKGGVQVQAQRWFYFAVTNYTALLAVTVYDIVIPALCRKLKRYGVKNLK